MRLNIYVKDMTVLNHIREQINQSAYIVNLVKSDMNSKEKITKEKVIELIKQYGGNMDNKANYGVNESISSIFDI